MNLHRSNPKKVKRGEGLPEVICNSCIYRLGAAYHFKQQCENSDFRLRSFLGILDDSYGTRDNETNTELSMMESAKEEKLIKTAKRYYYRLYILFHHSYVILSNSNNVFYLELIKKVS